MAFTSRQQQVEPISGQLIASQLPTAGINARDALVSMAPTDALNLVNFFAEPYGLTMRGGYQEYATDLPGSVPVKTLMSYYPAVFGPSSAVASAPASARNFMTRRLAPRVVDVTVDGQIFACTNRGIYDVSEGGAGPWDNLLAPVAPSDYWTWLNFQNAAGNFILAANDEGMYIVHSAIAAFSTGFSPGFSVVGTGFDHIAEGVDPGQIDGVDPDLFCYVMVWKRRLWFIEKDSTRAWYLPVEQITGTATQFDFGAQFRHGGYLVSLSNWTLDGGEGIDDYLVALSSQGDVVIFKGYDPDTADTDPSAFQLHGIWYVGALPIGRRQTNIYGGDLYILSVYGITQLSKLVAQAQVASNLVEDVTARIDPYISELMRDHHAREGWYVKFLPRDQMMVLGIPQQITGEGTVQLAMKIRGGAWSKMLDLPLAWMLNHGTLAFGGGDAGGTVDGSGKVYLLFDNLLDNVPLEEDTGIAIRGRVIPAYQGFNTPGQYKRFPMIRPILRSPITPTMRLTVLTDYTGSNYYSAPTLPIYPAAVWDEDLWDVGTWGGFMPPIRKWLGTRGGGFAATVQMDIVGVGGLMLMSLDWWVVPGGPL